MSSMLFTDEREDLEKNESIDNFSDIFVPFTKKIPTLEQALFQMIKERLNNTYDIELYIKDVIKNCTDYVENNFSDIKKEHPEINKKEAIIITSYTYQCHDNDLFEANAPYRILNQNLVSENRKKGISNVSMYLFIFLKAVRKIPKYIPENKKNYKLYRCITRLVDQNPNPKNPKFVPYCEGNIKTFYGFASTTPDRDTAIEFLNEVEVKEISKNKKQNIIKGIKKGTIFKLYFKKVNAYDIHLFNYFGEYEVLLEPETKYVINECEEFNEIINLSCKIVESKTVLRKVIEGNNNKIKGKIINKKNYIRKKRGKRIKLINIVCKNNKMKYNRM